MKNISVQLQKISQNDKLIALRARFGHRKFMAPLAAIVLLLLISTIFVGFKASTSRSASKNVTPTSAPTVTVTPTTTATSEAALSPTKKPVVSAKAVSPTLKPSAMTFPTRTAFPTRAPTPYVPLSFEITFPSENQTINATNFDDFCVMDRTTAALRDYRYVVKRHNINNEGWTAYMTPYYPCFYPEEGMNTVQFQWKDTEHNDETGVLTRHFIYHYPAAPSPTEVPQPTDTPMPPVPTDTPAVPTEIPTPTL